MSLSVAQVRRRKVKKRKGRGGLPKRVNHIVRFVPQNVYPDEMDVILDYPAGFVMVDAGSQHIAKRFQVNCPYDVDPTLGSTSTPGFAEWASFYSYSRTVKAQITCHTSNLCTNPIGVFLINSNSDPGTAGTNYFDMACFPNNKHAVLSLQGGGKDTVTFSQSYSLSKITGSSVVETDDNFASLNNTVPANKVWFGVGGLSLTANNITPGVAVLVYIRMWIRFYERVNTLTSFSKESFEATRCAWKIAQGQKKS